MANTSILAAFERMWAHVVLRLDAKASQTSLDTHTSNTTVHITSAERTNWNAAEANANTYTDEKIANIFNNSTTAVDSIMELAAAMADNADAIEALETIAAQKQATITGGATTITSSNLTANRALISNGSGKVAVSAVTSTELGYLDGVTSAIQTQLNGKASSSHDHNASNINAGTLSSDRLPTIPVSKGGTGATTAAAARTNLDVYSKAEVEALIAEALQNYVPAQMHTWEVTD